MIGPFLITALLSRLASRPLAAQFRDAGLMAVPQEVQLRQDLRIGGAEIEVDTHLDRPGLQRSDILEWVRRAASAVTAYYGTFPVQRARVIVTQSQDDDQSIHGTTWGDVGGVQGLSRMRLGAGVTNSDLDEDWTMTHELVHMALSSLQDESHWLEEGLATYVEPIARAQAGQLPVEKVWEGAVQGMPHGEPGRGDRGLDQTHTWGRTYWGGALFCLVADIKIREATYSREGLQDALRGIVAAGATINTEQPVERVLGVGDRATGTTVLVDLYNSWKNHPVAVDLDQLWIQLGVRTGPHGIQLDSSAPLASIRAAITTSREFGDSVANVNFLIDPTPTSRYGNRLEERYESPR